MSKRTVYPDTAPVQQLPDDAGDVFRVVMVRPDKATNKLVEVRDCKPLVIKAAHQYEAIEKYKFACGIISTDNSFDVRVIKEEDELYKEAKDLPLRDPNAPPLLGMLYNPGADLSLGVNAI